MRDYKQIAFITLTTGALLFSSTGYALDLTAESTNPAINFEIPTSAASPDWIMSANGSSWDMQDNANGITVFQVSTSTNNENTLIANLSGDVSLADDAVTIIRTTKQVGIATTTPESDLHVAGNGDLTLDDVTSESKWGLTTQAAGGFALNDKLASTNPLQIEGAAPTDSVHISPTGVGIGVADPQAKLDVAGDLRATFDGMGSKNLQTLFVMSANNTDSGKKSDAGFVVKNTRENFSYAFRTLEKFTRPGETAEIDGGFAISKQATGAHELVLINPSTNDPEQVELYLSNGASNVNGQWVNASSRSYKKNIHELSSEDAMQAMRDLKSVTYQFKRDKGNEKMIGFIAEDVPELLATKTRKTVDPLRIVAVLTKAVQEQDKALISKDKKIAKMEARAEQNTSRLERLEAQLDKLMMD